MAPRSRPRWPLAASLRLYQLLLVLYPPRFRRAFGPQMAQVFGDCCAEVYRCGGTPALLRLWADTLRDLLTSVPRERLERFERPRARRAAAPAQAPAGAFFLEAGPPAGHVPDSPRRSTMPTSMLLSRRLKRFLQRMRPQPGSIPLDDRLRFERFTERARHTLHLAQEEAQRLNHHYIGTEHLLLGLVREGDGVAAKVLAGLGIRLDAVRDAVIFIIGRGDRRVEGEVGLTPRSKKVIQLAFDEARRLNHHYLGTEHLLLGLVREGDGIAAGVLERLGANLDDVRTQTLRVLADLSGSPPDRSVEDGPGHEGQEGSGDSGA
jgi:hypothetical protein